MAFDNIKPFEYHQTLQYLDYSRELIDIAKEYSGSTVSKSSEELDQIMLEYLKCRPQSKLLTVWHKVIKKELIEYLNEIGHVYYIKYIQLTFGAAKALLYQIYAETVKCKDMESIEDMRVNIYK